MNSPHESDKILDHTRQQLSALVDGELAPNEAAFLMRRLQHDQELAGCWERWQLVGAVMRGQGGVRVAEGFGARVMDAVAREPAPLAAKPSRRWLHWTGGALAASVALVALLMARPAGPSQDAARATPALAQAQVPQLAPAPTPIAPTPKAPTTSDTAAQLASTVAVADVPRRMANARRGSGQAQRAAMRAHERAAAPVQAVAPQQEVAVVAAPAGNPFSTHHALPASRPWPRALVPGMPASGAFTVDYGNTAPAPSFFPFEPARLQQPQRAEPQPVDNSP